jgi:hypothetical protein
VLGLWFCWLVDRNILWSGAKLCCAFIGRHLLKLIRQLPNATQVMSFISPTWLLAHSQVEAQIQVIQAITVTKANELGFHKQWFLVRICQFALVIYQI